LGLFYFDYFVNFGLQIVNSIVQCNCNKERRINMNELEKAGRIINDRDYKAADIEKKTGISRQTISNYRRGRVMLENATWPTVHALAEYHDTIRSEQ